MIFSENEICLLELEFFNNQFMMVCTKSKYKYCINLIQLDKTIGNFKYQRTLKGSCSRNLKIIDMIWSPLLEVFCFVLCRIDHGKATVLEGKVTRVVILSVHHGVYQLWGPITFKPLESFHLPIPHLKLLGLYMEKLQYWKGRLQEF